MRFLKIQISTKFLEPLGLMDMVEGIRHLEIINAYQYDQHNFFSMQRITPEWKLPKSNLEEFLKKRLSAHYVQVLERKLNQITCILRQKRAHGFFPLLQPGPWAIIPPLIIDQKMIITSIISTEEQLPNLFRILETYKAKYTILAYTKYDSGLSSMNLGFHPSPHFTQRQKEIATFAIRKGYYNIPKKIKASDIAAHFGISESTLNEHLRKAEGIAMHYFFGYHQ